MHAKSRALQTDGFRNWRKRNEIGLSICLNGEVGDVYINELAPLMQNFRKSLIDYRPENIFSMDKSGLFFRALPARTYLVNSEKRRDVRGIKALTAKDRVTIIFCVNATGTRKVPPLIVGSSKTPHCFQDSRPPLPYINQANSWVNSAVYRHWWGNVLVPKIRSWTKEPVGLVMDNFSGHDLTCTDETGQITQSSLKISQKFNFTSSTS